MSNSTITSSSSSSSLPTSSAVDLTSSTSYSSSSTSYSSTAANGGSASGPAVVTSTATGSSADPTTNYITSFVTASDSAGSPIAPTTIVQTIFRSGASSPTNTPPTVTSSSDPAASSSQAAALEGHGNNTGDRSSGGGLSTGGKTAIAVVIPVVVVALLVIAAILLWRRRKQKKENQEQRRKEVEDYTYNPNNDPTLPAVASEHPEMAEDTSGYRGWGGAVAAASNRKTSTTMTGNTHAPLSDAGSNPHHSSGSGGYSDGNSSGDPFSNRRETMGSDELGALGAGPGAVGMAAATNGMRRGPSNASSRYSAGAHSETSDEPVPPLPVGQAYDYNPGAGYGYGQHGPYGDGTYGGGQDAGMPVVRDVSARRNTRIQQPGQYQQGNSGIAQNF